MKAQLLARSSTSKRYAEDFSKDAYLSLLPIVESIYYVKLKFQ